MKTRGQTKKSLSKADSEVFTQALISSSPMNAPMKQAFLSWDSWFGGKGVSDAFMTDRDQPPEQRR